MKATPTTDFLALVFASLFPLGMTYLYFVVLAADPENSWLLQAYSAGKLLQFPFPLVYVFLFHRHRFPQPRRSAGGIGLGVAFGVLVGLFIVGAYWGWLKHSDLIARTPANLWDKVRGFGLATPLGFLFLGIFICLIHSGLEEYYWRWFVFGWMNDYLPTWLAILLSSVAFMLHHVVVLWVYFPDHFWSVAVLFSLFVAVGGGVWAWIYGRSGSLWGPWISHVLADVAILIVGYDLIRGYFPA